MTEYHSSIWPLLKCFCELWCIFQLFTLSSWNWRRVLWTVGLVLVTEPVNLLLCLDASWEHPYTVLTVKKEKKKKIPIGFNLRSYSNLNLKLKFLWRTLWIFVQSITTWLVLTYCVIFKNNFFAVLRNKQTTQKTTRYFYMFSKLLCFSKSAFTLKFYLMIFFGPAGFGFGLRTDVSSLSRRSRLCVCFLSLSLSESFFSFCWKTRLPLIISKLVLLNFSFSVK